MYVVYVCVSVFECMHVVKLELLYDMKITAIQSTRDWQIRKSNTLCGLPFLEILSRDLKILQAIENDIITP